MRCVVNRGTRRYLHDWLPRMRGGENSAQVLVPETYPDGDLLTLFHVRADVLPNHRTASPTHSALQRSPAATILRYCLVFPAVIEQLILVGRFL